MPLIWSGLLIVCYLLFLCNCWEVTVKQADLYYRDCMVVPENNFSTLVMMPNKAACGGILFHCWKSQLTLLSKANLTWMYNLFRNEYAKKFNINGMIKVNWHWMLESEAIKILKDCPTDRRAIIETRNVGGLDYQMSCEESIITIRNSFRTQTDFVNSFPQILRQQLKENYNYPDNEAGYFILPGVSHFGCATMFQQDIGARFICIYCAKEDRLSSDSKCPSEYEKNKDNHNKFSHLCEALLQVSVYGCEPPTLQKHCLEPQPDNRDRNYGGLTRRMYAMTDGEKYLIFVNGSNGEQIGEVVPSILGCEKQVGQRCAPTLPAWNYVYDSELMQRLNSTVFFLDNQTLIRYGDLNIDVRISQATEYQFKPSSCCMSLFILYILSSMPIAALMYYTYKHYKQHHR